VLHFSRTLTLLIFLTLPSSLTPPCSPTCTVSFMTRAPAHRRCGRDTARIRLRLHDHSKTNADGEFDLRQAPLGVYTLKVSATGFATAEQPLTVASGTNPVVHIPLAVASATQTVVVTSGDTSLSAADTVTPTTLITRQDIDQTPGASRTIGMEMITDYVPGAYMTHDMLHMRGGHQTSWLIDGVAIRTPRSHRTSVRRSTQGHRFA